MFITPHCNTIAMNVYCDDSCECADHMDLHFVKEPSMLRHAQIRARTLTKAQAHADTNAHTYNLHRNEQLNTYTFKGKHMHKSRYIQANAVCSPRHQVQWRICCQLRGKLPSCTSVLAPKAECAYFDLGLIRSVKLNFRCDNYQSCTKTISFVQIHS